MAATADTQPIATINITPLIDVLLVLLIMMILTLPVATHKVAIDLPQSPPIAPTQLPKMHELAIAANGAISLDGVAIDEAALSDGLAAIAGDSKAAVTLRADPASNYNTFDRVLATVKRAGISRLGFAGNEQYANAF